MRIRNYRLGDIPTLVHIQQLAAQTDDTESMKESDFKGWLTSPEFDAASNVFLITDDDETNEWGQAGTLEGVEGEVVGYTTIQLSRDQHAYHFLCWGTVLPQHRGRNAGRALFICALNRARIAAAEFEFEAEQQGYPIYFEALLPCNNPNAASLAAKCEMEATGERVEKGMCLYRRVL